MSLKLPQDGPLGIILENYYSLELSIPIARKREVGKAFNLDLPGKV